MGRRRNERRKGRRRNERRKGRRRNEEGEEKEWGRRNRKRRKEKEWGGGGGIGSKRNGGKKIQEKILNSLMLSGNKATFTKRAE